MEFTIKSLKSAPQNSGATCVAFEVEKNEGGAQIGSTVRLILDPDIGAQFSAGVQYKCTIEAIAVAK